MKLFSRFTAHHLTMSKELPSPTGSVGAFCMPGERPDHYQDDFSLLPYPPSVVVHLPTRIQRLKKSQSQPMLTKKEHKGEWVHRDTQIEGGITFGQVAEKKAEENNPKLQEMLTQSALPMATMTPSQNFGNISNSFAHSYSSVASRYETAPVYSSNQVLSSFHNKFRLFGHKIKSQDMKIYTDSLSTPTENNCVDNISTSLAQSRDEEKKSVSRTQSSLQKTTQSISTRTEVSVLDSRMDPSENKLAVDSRALDSTDSTMVTNLPLTSKVVEWLHGPNTKVKLNSSEMNALAPQSY